jgi:hypothetical protein
MVKLMVPQKAPRERSTICSDLSLLVVFCFVSQVPGSGSRSSHGRVKTFKNGTVALLFLHLAFQPERYSYTSITMAVSPAVVDRESDAELCSCMLSALTHSLPPYTPSLLPPVILTILRAEREVCTTLRVLDSAPEIRRPLFVKQHVA